MEMGLTEHGEINFQFMVTLTRHVMMIAMYSNIKYPISREASIYFICWDEQQNRIAVPN